MSQEQENVELEDKAAEDFAVEGRNTGNVWSILLLVLVFMLLGICTVLLVVAVNLNKEMDGIKAELSALQESNAFAISCMGYSGTEDLSDESGDGADDAEAADIAEAALLESRIVWEEGKDRTSGIRKVYLTFDDGPSSNTDKILDVLDEYGVKATFFVVGKEGYEDQYRRIVDEGHTLAMHSYSHVYSEIYSSLDAYQQDLNKLRTFLYELTGVECDLVRFPGGSSNTISKVDMRTLIDYLDSEGMVYFDWNVSSGDASGVSKSANQIASNVLDNIGQYDNAVVLLHDAAGKDSTVEALPIIIETILASEDTVLLPISEDTAAVQHIH